MTAALTGSHRSAENKARDRYRHPEQTLELFGLKPEQHVLEIEPGNGWYAELLAPILADRGKLVLAGPSPEGKSAVARLAAQLQTKLQSNEQLFGRAEYRVIRDFTLGEPSSIDLVVSFRNAHVWRHRGDEKPLYQAIFDVLKPGGVFGLVQHRGDPDVTLVVNARRGYLPESYVISQVEAVGFELVARSEINANPSDTKDYPQGVWTLPPTLALGDQDRERYLAIGESDRMTLSFRKP